MGKRRLGNRIRRMARKSLGSLWIPFLAFFISVIIFVLQVIWDEITSRYVGSPFLDTIENIVQQIDVGMFIQWTISHPIEVSATWFFTTFSIILILVYWQTRDPRRISLSEAIIRQDTGTYRDSGFAIINDSDNDLMNCTMYVSSIDGHKTERRYKSDFLLRWGEYSDTTSSEGTSIEIPQTEKGYIYVNQMQPWIQNIDRDKFYGTHEVELIFHATTKTGETIPYLPVYCMIDAGQMEVKGFTTERILLRKVET